MRKKLLLTFTILSIALVGAPSAITITCIDGAASAGGACAPGRVSFSGNNFPSSVHVTLTRDSDGTSYDSWDYNTGDDGWLRFTENLTPGGSYTLTLSGSNLNKQINITTN